MSKFCTTCGAQLEDSATFCTSCGASQDAQPKQTSAAASAADSVKNTFNDIKDKVDVGAIKDSLTMDNIKSLKTNPNKNTIIALSCVAVVAIIVIVLVFSLLFGGGYKKPVDKAFKGMAKADASAWMASLPKCQVEFMEEKVEDSDAYSNYDNAEELYEEMVEKMQEGLEEEFGEDIKISYSVEKKKSLSDKKLKDIRDTLKDSYDAKGIKVTKGYKLDLEVKIKGDDYDDEEDMDVTVAKVDGDWCIVGGDLEFMSSISSLF